MYYSMVHNISLSILIYTVRLKNNALLEVLLQSYKITIISIDQYIQIRLTKVIYIFETNPLIYIIPNRCLPKL